MIVDMGRDAKNGIWFTIHLYPCCDGYIHNLEKYSPVFEEDSFKYELTERISFVESNLNSQKNLPDEFDMDSQFILKNECFLYYQARRPVFAKLGINLPGEKSFKTFYPFAVYDKGSTGTILAKKITTIGDTLYFVRMNKEYKPLKGIRNLSWDINLIQFDKGKRDQIKTNYLGWVNSKNIEF